MARIEIVIEDVDEGCHVSATTDGAADPMTSEVESMTVAELVAAVMVRAYREVKDKIDLKRAARAAARTN